MKKLYSLLFAIAVFFTFSSSLSAQGAFQNYFNSTYEWYETENLAIFISTYPPCYTDGGSEYTRSYFHIVGTDSVDGFHWYKVHRDWQNVVQCGAGSPMPQPPEPAAGVFRIREDSTGKIWTRTNDSTIVMSYDFRPGILVGDTLWMNDYQDYCEVILIDSVSLGTERRARYWCEDCGYLPEPNRDVYVVEGVGLNQGFFRSDMACDGIWDFDAAISCCKKDGATLSMHPWYLCNTPGHIIVGVDDELETDLEFTWHAASERILVKGLDPLETRAWMVYDVQGRQMAKGDRLNQEVHLPDLASGMYIFVAEPVGNEKPISWRFLR